MVWYRFGRERKKLLYHLTMPIPPSQSVIPLQPIEFYSIFLFLNYFYVMLYVLSSGFSPPCFISLFSIPVSIDAFSFKLFVYELSFYVSSIFMNVSIHVYRHSLTWCFLPPSICHILFWVPNQYFSTSLMNPGGGLPLFVLSLHSFCFL